MDFKKIIKDKRVIYGGAGLLALVVVFVFFRARSAPTEASEEGNSDSGFLYFPTDFGSALGLGGGAGATTTTDPTASMLDLAKQQVKSQTQLGIGTIGADFLSQLTERFKTKAPTAGKFLGATGTFGFDEGGMLDFDFSFKNVVTTPATPKQNISPPPVQQKQTLGQGGNK